MKLTQEDIKKYGTREEREFLGRDRDFLFSLAYQILELVDEQLKNNENSLTTSDLQAAVSSIVQKTLKYFFKNAHFLARSAYEDQILEFINNQVNSDEKLTRAELGKAARDIIRQMANGD